MANFFSSRQSLALIVLLILVADAHASGFSKYMSKSAQEKMAQKNEKKSEAQQNLLLSRKVTRNRTDQSSFEQLVMAMQQ